MDVLRINRTSFQPMDLVEGFSSIIWTERYNVPGDFEFRTPDIDRVRGALPLECLVSLRETTEVAMVETHEIEKDDDGEDVLVVRGRTLDFFIEHRVVTSEWRWYNKPWRMHRNYTIAQTVEVILWNFFVNNSDAPVLGLGQNDYWIYSGDYYRIKNSVVTDTTPSPEPGESRRRWLRDGPIDDKFWTYLIRGDLGFRTWRPPSRGGRVWVAAGRGNPNIGIWHKEPWEDINDLRWDIYNGLDRTVDQLDNPNVIFTYDQGHLSDAKYLFNRKDHKDLISVASDAGGQNEFYSNDIQPTGFDMRQMFYDIGPTPEYPPDATQAERDAWWDFIEDIQDTAMVQLQKQNRGRFILSTGISPTAPYVYGVDYNLGDKVTVKAEYGGQRTMVVTEYTRTQDAEGERGFPGFIYPYELNPNPVPPPD